ncbi:MAG TPA: hypothetical protein PLZ57_01090 [Pseudobdellovibrionaceae bacterium]|nr:hypothetical protein [Pseudobdellovibrionaceae bacterium]
MSPHWLIMTKQCLTTQRTFSGLWIGILLVSLLLVGCSRPHPEPEKLDPIYLDLKAEESKAQTAAEALAEEIKLGKEELAKLPPRDPGRRKAEQDLRNQASQLVQIEQMQQYYQIRAKQRVAYARDEYLKAFERNQPWPKPEDFEAYKKSKQLQSIDKNWGSRVPKQTRYNRKPEAEIKKQLEEAQKATK